MDVKSLKNEKNRLKRTLKKAQVPNTKIEALEPVIDNIAYLRLKLDEVRQQMQDESIVCSYDNGGGQEGTRQNPIFKAYEDLYKSYMTGLKTYLEAIPKDLQEEVKQEKTTLAKVISMKKKKA